MKHLSDTPTYLQIFGNIPADKFPLVHKAIESSKVPLSVGLAFEHSFSFYIFSASHQVSTFMNLHPECAHRGLGCRW